MTSLLHREFKDWLISQKCQMVDFLYNMDYDTNVETSKIRIMMTHWGKRSRKQFEYQNSKMSSVTTLQDMSIVENKSDKERYSSFGQLVISIPLQTVKVNKMNLRSNNASPKEDMIQLKPASKYKKTILSGKNLKFKTKKPSPSTLTISPDGETKFLRAFDFIYRPVNSVSGEL